jgi:hypothetical protein
MDKHTQLAHLFGKNVLLIIFNIEMLKFHVTPCIKGSYLWARSSGITDVTK